MLTHIIIKIGVEGEPQRFLEAWRRGEGDRVRAGAVGTETVFHAAEDPNEVWILVQWNGDQEAAAGAAERAVREAAGASGAQVVETHVKCLSLKDARELGEEIVSGEGI